MTAFITEPGIYNLDDDVYHGDPLEDGSLSSTGARKLLPPSTPAHYRWWADHGEEHRAVFDFGQAAHAKVLGVGRETVVVDAKAWTTKDAKAARGEAYAAGKIPLLTHEAQQVDAMAEALQAHPLAAALLNPGGATVEHAIIWRDAPTGVWRRAKLDALRYLADGRAAVVDYKTSAAAAPDEFARSVHRYGYHQQADFYLDGIRSVGLGGDDAVFLFVVQEKTAPYLVSVAQLDVEAMTWGARLNRAAVDLYAQCTATGRWPGYGDSVHCVDLPAYAVNAYEAAAYLNTASNLWSVA
jgi:PDDEXK-like domain of unknown function (DUF3799)